MELPAIVLTRTSQFWIPLFGVTDSPVQDHSHYVVFAAKAPREPDVRHRAEFSAAARRMDRLHVHGRKDQHPRESILA